MNSKLKTYIIDNGFRFVEELKEFLKIPSVSTDNKYQEDVIVAARHLKDRLCLAGADNTQILQTNGFPVVYGEKWVDAELPTILVYGHYDVQPADPIELWHSDPFEPVVRDGKIYARGACDDKGQLYMHVKAIEFMHEQQDFPCNLKFLFEGEEEIGSKNLPAFVEDHKDLLSCDMVVVSDTAMLGMDRPSMITGLKGVVLFELELEGPARDLHSGIYGGTVANPIHKLCGLIDQLHDAEGRISIPGFYDDVIPVTDADLKNMKACEFNELEFLRDTGAMKIQGESGYTTLARQGYRPSLEVNGIWGGYTGEGAKTVLPSKAHAKISIRTVPGQTCEKVARQFTEYLNAIAGDEVTLSIKTVKGCEPVVTDVDGLGFKAASEAIEQTFGKKPIPTRMGGSIPIVPMFNEQLGVETVLLGFGLDTDNLHSPNEHFALENFFKGIQTIPLFFQSYAKLFKASRKEASVSQITL